MSAGYLIVAVLLVTWQGCFVAVAAVLKNASHFWSLLRSSSALHVFSKERHLARKGQPPPLRFLKFIEPRKNGGNDDFLLSLISVKIYILQNS